MMRKISLVIIFVIMVLILIPLPFRHGRVLCKCIVNKNCKCPKEGDLGWHEPLILQLSSLIFNPQRKVQTNITSCGIENCHGLDISCGPNVPQSCDLMYGAGDNCRQYASCQTINGRCTLKTTLEFDNCKECVEVCNRENQNDPEKYFECERLCWN